MQVLRKVVAAFMMLSLTLAGYFPYATIANAASAPPTILSYQGRLADSGGNLLGGTGTTYYFQFSLWTSPTVGSGTQVWPAATPGTTTATVTQGVFNVNIGDTANGYPDALNINFANYPQLYLQVQVSANNNNSETLTPRQQLTSSIYSQVAGAVVGTSQSAFGTTTHAFNSTVTVAATSSNVTGLTIVGALSQSANLLQIQSNAFTNLFSVSSAGAVTTAASTTIGGVFNAVSGLSTLSNMFSVGSSTIAGAFNSVSSNLLGSTTLLGNSLFGFATTTNFAITGTSNSLLKTLSNGAVVAAVAGVDYAAGNVAFEFAPTTLFGSTANATSTLIGFTNGIYALASSTVGNGTQAGGLTISGGATTTGNFLIQTPVNSSIAFQVQNSQGAPIFSVDTTSTNYLINPGFEVNTNGWVLDGATSATRVTNARYHGIASLQIATPATANAGIKNATFNTALLSGTQYTLSFYAQTATAAFATLRAGRAEDGVTESVCTLNTTTVVTTGWTRFYCTFTTGAISGSPYIFIEQSDATSRTFNIDAIQLQTGTVVTPYTIGGTQLRGIITAPASFNSTSNSNTAFQIQDASSTANLFIADTLNSVINIGTSTGLSRLTIQGTTTNELLEVARATGASAFRITSAGNVGVGTTSPFVTFSVNGNGFFGGSITATNLTATGTLSVAGNAVITGSATTTNFAVISSSTVNGAFNVGGKTFFGGLVGIGTTTPWASLTVSLSSTTPGFAVGALGSTTPSLFVSSANQNGFVGIGTSTNLIATTSLLIVGNSRIAAGQTIAVFSNAGGAAYLSNLGLAVSSDQRLKKNINPLTAALANVLALQPVTYNFNSEDDSAQVHAGFIAQQAQNIFPDLVQTNGQGFLSFNYGGLTPFLASAIQAQQLEITALASSSATTTTDQITKGPFSDASANLLDAVKNAFGSIIDISQNGVREFGVAVHATVGVFDKLFAKEVHTDKLCVGDTCVTQQQFLQMVQSANASNGAAQATPSNTAPSASDPAPTEQESASSTNTQSDTVQSSN